MPHADRQEDAPTERMAGVSADLPSVPKAACPSLRDLCLEQIAGAKITMPNVLAALELSHTHDIPEMRQKAERFLRDSWRGVRARHAHPELEAALGSELLGALDREQAELDAAVRKLKTLGDVAAVSPPPPSPPPPRTQRGGMGRTAAAAPPSDDVDARRAPARRFNFGGPSEKCVKCGKTVYKAERVAVDRQVRSREFVTSRVNLCQKS
jgi:hypothetical protein